MLTLTRKPGDNIYIGDDIEVVIKEVRGGSVRIGIAAPKSTFIARGELYRRIHGTPPVAAVAGRNHRKP